MKQAGAAQHVLVNLECYQTICKPHCAQCNHRSMSAVCMPCKQQQQHIRAQYQLVQSRCDVGYCKVNDSRLHANARWINRFAVPTLHGLSECKVSCRSVACVCTTTPVTFQQHQLTSQGTWSTCARIHPILGPCREAMDFLQNCGAVHCSRRCLQPSIIVL